MHGRPAQLEVQVVETQLSYPLADIALHTIAELIVLATGLLILNQRLTIGVSFGQTRKRRVELQADG